MSTYDVVLEDDDDPEGAASPCDIITPSDDEVTSGIILGRSIRTDDDRDNGIGGIVQPDVRTALRSLSDKEAALAKARDLKKVMLDHGVPEVSIELQTGRPNSYGEWDALFVVCDMSHHIVSSYSVDRLTPGLSLIKHGRSDLSGPLANGYGGWDLCYRIITFGYANHPGEGGPYTVPALTAGTFTIPQDSARRYAWGTEWEGGLRDGDWDRILRNPRTDHKMTFREFMGRCNAALEEYHQIHEYAHLEHSTWTNRKIDRLNYTASRGIREKEPYRNATRDWFDMATTEDLKKVVEDVVLRTVPTVPIVMELGDTNVSWPLQKVLRHLHHRQDRILAASDPKVLAAAIAANLPQGDGSGVTPEQVEEAAEKAIRDVLGGLNDSAPNQ